MYRNILVATDGSDVAERATAQALELAKTLRAEVTAVTVTDIYPVGRHALMPQSADVGHYEERMATRSAELLDKVAAAAQAMGVPCSKRHIADELPAEGILRACKEQGCDLIVVGTHGRRGIERLLLGSQSSKVLAMSSVPVLICR